VGSVSRRERAAHLRVADRLRDQILSHELEPGHHLIERELCETTGFSRPVVREALRVLESEGLVSSSLARGTHVTALEWSEARAIYEVRASLESLAARLFTLNANARQLVDLRDSAREIRASVKNVTRYLAAKEQFYDVLLEGAGNDFLAEMLSTVNMRTRVLRLASLSAPGRPASSVLEMMQIVAAIESGDANAAAAACQTHVQNAALAAEQSLGSAQS